ncbi:DUF2442 domain-containing protein [Burkholderia sp. PU8-34]
MNCSRGIQGIDCRPHVRELPGEAMLRPGRSMPRGFPRCLNAQPLLQSPRAWFPRLLSATQAQRAAVRISASGNELHWEELDEDMSVAGLLLCVGDLSKH